ncbi:MAG TPA: phospholipid carrier-dependent glycosyltransferase [Leptolyngbyaceae cyanobacterium M33_DOE_097]|uniref:Polyprenol-phosphate-mannose--protein mannosyltransferase n=1 Tax=Oscillatoriales cyanobacterium SpSt-418 TaxID=2282169 RepID=A0A7C3KBT8_9CYAN|nr:phospholipid carrier-dependent glycosyltransferase [Leptolyngbyaceae cyanobacterium M33_DOE_097]
MGLVKPSPKSLPIWFWWSLAVILGVSLALRFWGLGRFNTLVFDEVYYVKFAKNYLSQTPYFDGHPPLGKYVLAIAIWFGNLLPFGRDAINDKAGLTFSTFSYRWFNALTGAFIPLIIAGLAYQLTQRRRYALLAGSFAALDGMLLVESRYALNNTYILILGLLSLWFLVIAASARNPLYRVGWLTAAGIAFGLGAGIKWNGLWFLFGAYGLIAIAKLWHWRQTKQSLAETDPAHPTMPRWMLGLARLKIWHILLYLAVVPFVFYALSWIPHLALCQADPQGLCRPYVARLADGTVPPISPLGLLVELNSQILRYHQQVGGNDPTVHPYCSAWFSWLLMLRPVAYFYQVTPKGAPLPAGQWKIAPAENTVIYDVHSMGNPILWWLSTAAIVLMAVTLGRFLMRQFNQETTPPLKASDSFLDLTAIDLGLLIFLLVNYATNLLPWLRVSRCTFLYHYLPASVFAWMGFAWLCDRWLASRDSQVQWVTVSLIGVIALAFLFWLPIYLGLPLDPVSFQWRMWLPTWI